MAKRFAIVNALLGLVALAQVVTLMRTWAGPDAWERPPRSEGATAREQEGLTVGKVGLGPPSAYEVIVERDFFLKPPSPAPSNFRSEPVSPPPPPLPTLLGIIMEEDRKRAILREGPSKPKFYGLGERVAGGVIVDIFEDRILLKRGEVVSEILMQKAIQPVGSLPNRLSQSENPEPVEEELEQEEELEGEEPSQPPVQARPSRLPFAKRSSSLGLIIAPLHAGERVVVNAVIPGSPSGTAGIKRGDIITRINSQEVTQMGMADINAVLQGERGLVTFTLERGGQTLEVQVHPR